MDGREKGFADSNQNPPHARNGQLHASGRLVCPLCRRGFEDGDQPDLARFRSATLIRVLRYVGATDAELEKVDERIREWSRGSVFIGLTPGSRNLLRIRPPWSDGLNPAN